MKQILLHLGTGENSLAEISAPVIEPGHLLILTRRSLVSQGTEKMLLSFGKASLFQKARAHPEKVRQVLAKIRTEGLLPSLAAVFRKLDEPIPLGYCNVGEVIGVGSGVHGFMLGDRVASNGPHAEVINAPPNLVAKIPDDVDDDEATFTVVGAIALQGIRLARPEFGEAVAVIGLGLIGQLTVQLLRASGCQVLGYDLDPEKVKIARTFGVEAVCVAGDVDPVQHAMEATAGLGVDAVLITASTQSNDVIAQSAHMSRKRGRIVLIGVVGLQLNRADFYDKELTFQVSCSYGPGRYDNSYEGRGVDYPVAYVRWTENRNFLAILAAMATNDLSVTPLITRSVPLDRYQEVYNEIDEGIASLLEYSTSPRMDRVTLTKNGFIEAGTAVLAIVGAGNFSKMTALPALAAAKVPLKYIVSARGVTAAGLARKYRIPFSSTEMAEVLADPSLRGVIITTRHNLHVAQALMALRAGKHVLVEKPLCMSTVELHELEAAVRAIPPEGPTISVGYNRRFSPHAEKLKQLLEAVSGPVSIVASMNAGAVPATHWVHDPGVGGGRILGEACHFIDFSIFVSGSQITEVCAVALGDGRGTDTASILLQHANGSTAVINYFANGHRELSKERIEVHVQGRSLMLDNFRELHGYGFNSFSSLKTRQDKGHRRQFALFHERLQKGGPPLIPWSEVTNSARATLAALRSLETHRWVAVADI